LGGGAEDTAPAMGHPHHMAITEHPTRSYLDGDVSLELPCLDVPAASRKPRDDIRMSLIACSRCLRVLRDETWVRAETVIGELRTFEYEAPPRLEPVLCPLCTSSLRLYRGGSRVPLRRAVVRGRGHR
jgi:hypothetical protein